MFNLTLICCGFFSLVLTDSGHSKLYQVHLKKKLTHDYARKFNIKDQDSLKQKFTQDDCDHFENLLISKATGKKPHMVFLQGVAGIGKSLMLTKLMLAWSEGMVFQNKFSYIFYFCCQDVKKLKRASLAELISKEWPNASAPIEEILSQPEKLLFVIDNLEVMECDMSEWESELCDDCMEKQPVNILMSSLLRRKMLPESSFLVSATPETFEKIEDRIECTNVKMMAGFNESNIKMSFHRLFQDRNRAHEAFSLVRENEQLFTVCQVPVLCWMVATCLKKEIEKGETQSQSADVSLPCIPLTSSICSFPKVPNVQVRKAKTSCRAYVLWLLRACGLTHLCLVRRLSGEMGSWTLISPHCWT